MTFVRVHVTVSSHFQFPFPFFFLFYSDEKDLPIGGVVFAEGLLEAKDADAGINALVEYRVVPGGGRGGGDVSDGYGTFHFASPHQSIVTLAKSLDYESVRRYTLTVVASVNN